MPCTQASVLIVDDDHDFCETLWQLLNDRHYRVTLAHNEEEGIQKAQQGEYQVALIDLRLGPGDGRKVFDRFMRANPQAKTILVTGHHDDGQRVLQDLGEHGVDGVCYKPVEMEKLMTAIGATDVTH